MDHRLGYAALNLTLGKGASHTCRLANATPERLQALIAKNLEELEELLLFNETHRIHVYRISSSLVPYASHACNQLPWWKIFGTKFARLASLARRSGQRLSMHPSPAAASLSSARARVREAAVAELEYSTKVLDLLEHDGNARVVVHLGGGAPTRADALSTADRLLDRMPKHAKKRLAIEHDCRIWAAREIAPLAFHHGLPLIADLLHDEVLPSDPPLSPRELLRMAAKSWTRLGLRSKHHLASQRLGGRPGAHADFIAIEDYERAVGALEEPADFILEAKKKELAVFALRDHFGGEEARGLNSLDHQPSLR